MNGLVIDCGCCVMRGRGCADCVVSALLGAPEGDLPVLDVDEQRALRVFSEAGMLPPLRLVRPVGPAQRAGPERWVASG